MRTLWRQLCQTRREIPTRDIFERYLDSIKHKRSNTAAHFTLKYGDSVGPKKHKDKCSKRSGKYSIPDVMKRYKCTYTEATAMVATRKANSAGNLAKYIRVHGEVEGKRRHAEFVSKTRNSKENYLKRYGAEAEEKWEKYTRLKDSSSLQSFIKKFGAEVGPVKFNEKVKKCVSNFDSFVRKYGAEAAHAKYAEYVYSKTSHKFVAGGATLQSLELFNPLIANIADCPFKLYIGVPGNKEYYLYSKENQRIFFYDFTIPDLKLIIEFNGQSHPPANLDILEKNKWRCPYRGISHEEASKLDELKLAVANKRGFKVISVRAIEFSQNKAGYIEQLTTQIKDLYENHINQKH